MRHAREIPMGAIVEVINGATRWNGQQGTVTYREWDNKGVCSYGITIGTEPCRRLWSRAEIKETKA